MSNDETRKQTIGKPKLHLVPTQIVYYIAPVREFGNKKYEEGGPDNWKTVDPVEYRDAAYRHLLAEIENPGSIAADSGLTHLAHLACNIAFLCQLHYEEQQAFQMYCIDKDIDPSYYFNGSLKQPARWKEDPHGRSISVPIQCPTDRHDQDSSDLDPAGSETFNPNWSTADCRRNEHISVRQ
jgi:hypothetical protein